MRAGLFFIGILMAASPLWARQEEAISVKAEVDKAILTVGELVEYRVTVTHDPSLQILSQVNPPLDEAFEIKEGHDISEKQGKQIVEGRRFILTTFELGEFILEPVTVRYRTAKGIEKNIQTNRLYLTVRSVDPSGRPMTDIRNVKGMLPLPRRWGWLFGLVLLILLGGGGLYFWDLWKHRTVQAEEVSGPALSLEDEALLRLNRLFDSDLLRKGRLKEYFLELSDILRRYFEKRYEIQTVESTTSEVLRDLNQRELAQDLMKKIRQVLEISDLVKFAKWKPEVPEILRMNQLAKTIIEEARPKVEV